MTQNRIKEIGIRKVLGASVWSITSLLSRELTVLVIIANLAAWPAGYFIMRKWLENYAYKISISPWIFILAAVSALTVALFTVCFQTIRAATVNPVEILKDE